MQVRSEQEYIDLLKAHTFEDVRAVRVPDLTPTPEEYSGKWFKNAEELREFKRIGALLLIARKPDFRSPPPGYEVLLDWPSLHFFSMSRAVNTAPSRSSCSLMGKMSTFQFQCGLLAGRCDVPRRPRRSM